MGFPSAICLYSGNHSNHHLPDLILSSPLLKECWTRGWDLGGGSLSWTSWTSPPRLGSLALCTTCPEGVFLLRTECPSREKLPKPITTGKLRGSWSAFLLCPVCAFSATCLRQRELPGSQLLRRQIAVGDITSGREAGTVLVSRADTSIPSREGVTMPPLGPFGLDREMTRLYVTRGARNYLGVPPPPSQHCPPMEHGLGKRLVAFLSNPACFSPHRIAHVMFPWMVDFLPCLHQSTRILDLSTFPWSVWREKRVTQYQALFKAWKKGPPGVFLEALTWAFGLDFISQLRPENWRSSEAQPAWQHPGDQPTITLTTLIIQTE